jgi:hypothetical protein
MADWSDLKGLTVPAATEKVARYKHTLRIMKQGDDWAEPAPDYVESRINVGVSTDVEPVVVHIYGRG